MTRNERVHLNKLSKEVLGSTYKWQKVMNEGEKVPAKIKFKSGKEVDGFTLAYPTIEQVKASLEARAKEKAEKAKTDGTAQTNKN